MRRWVPVLLLLAACSTTPSESPVEADPTIVVGVETPPAAVELPWRESDDYDRAVAALNDEIAFLEREVETRGSWHSVESIAQRYQSRAVLTGDFEDWLRALGALEAAHNLAPAGQGPHLSEASILFSVHRLDPAEAALERASSGAIQHLLPWAAIEGVRGDLALHRLQLPDADGHYVRSEELDDTSASSPFRLGHLAWQRGEFDEADAHFVQAVRRLGPHTPRIEATMHLQRGLLDLDRGRYEDALAHYQEADEVFGGWWLIQEHIAEVVASLGDTQVARAAYEDVVERTQSPELMDALAGLLAEQGEVEASEALYARAGEIYEAQIERLPEAAYGHGLGHYFDIEDYARARELAEANFAARPNGEAHIVLAQALAATSELTRAVELMDAALASEFRSAALHATAAVLFEAAGNSTRATEQRDLAVAIHPEALEEVAWLAERLGS